MMMLVTIDSIPGRELAVLGMVRGSTVQCKNFGRDIMSSFKNLVGGEMESYTQLMNEARDIATQRMTEQALKMGADAVIGVRYNSAEIAQGAAEVMAYGTAVKFI